MARKKPARRIEPTFDGPRKAGKASGLSLTQADRVLPPKKGATRRKTAAKGRRRSRAGRGSARSPRRGFFGLVRKGVYWSLVLGLWGGIAATCIVIYYGAQMPSATTWAVPNRPPNVRIVSTGDDLIANRGVTGGEAVGLDEMSPFIPKAVVAIEDRRFYSHFGVDPIGLARAFVENVVEGHVTQGGSTLTQQLAKNLFLEPDRTLKRKVQEVLLSLWLEEKFTKDQILQMYLNRMYFGSGAYGVEAASRRYFGKPARDVTLAQAALLAGLLKAPSRLSPARDPKAAEQREQVVLAAMRDQGMVSDRQLATAMSAKPTSAPAYWTGSENYVADEIMDKLPDMIGTIRSDIVVHTTIDMTLQNEAEAAIRDTIDEKGRKRDVHQGALVSIDGGGAVRALVGGYSYAHSQFDRATDAHRQPGSAFKPFVYVAALEQGRTPESVRNDAPVKIGKWTPENYGGEYHGRVTLTEALADSMNSVAAQLVMEVGPKAVCEVAHRMGIQSDLKANASLALGTSEVTPLELTSAYLPFANGGYRPEVHMISRIETTGGKRLYSAPASVGPRVLSQNVVAMMNYMMADTVRQGTGRNAGFGWPAGGKTGTTQDSRDAWFVGYTRNLVTGVWFGNDDGSPTKRVTGGTLPALAWHQFMKAAHKGVPVQPLPGNWHPSPGPGMGAPTPSGALVSSMQEDDGMRGRPARQAQPPQVEMGHTSSIPRPPGSVGAPPPRGRSILDIILGK